MNTVKPIIKILAIFYLLLLAPIFAFAQKSTESDKPHLIVGNWEEINENINPNQLGQNLNLQQWFFSSNKKTSHLSTYVKKKEVRYNFIYKLIPNKENPSNPYIHLTLPDKKNQIIIFKIITLTKKLMILQLDEDKTKTTILLPTKPIEFKRIAGPPSNMDETL